MKKGEGLTMDDLDENIIDVLKKDSRRPFVEVAEQLQVSEGTIRSRVRKMTDDGIIKGFTIKTSSRNVKAMVEIRVYVNTDTDAVARTLAAQDGVTEVYEVTGDQDIIAIVDVESSQQLNDIIEKVRRYDNILSTRTRLILKEHFGG
jgi:DNA-binding Lrp family transcriptional regulator